MAFYTLAIVSCTLDCQKMLPYRSRKSDLEPGIVCYSCTHTHLDGIPCQEKLGSFCLGKSGICSQKVTFPCSRQDYDSFCSGLSVLASFHETSPSPPFYSLHERQISFFPLSPSWKVSLECTWSPAQIAADRSAGLN